MRRKLDRAFGQVNLLLFDLGLKRLGFFSWRKEVMTWKRDRISTLPPAGASAGKQSLIEKVMGGGVVSGTESFCCMQLKELVRERG